MKYGLKVKAMASFVFLFVLAALGYGALLWNNLTWLEDPHDVVDSADLVATNASQQMTRLPWGGFVANTKIEGSIEAVCKDGNRVKSGYVTPNSGQTYTVTVRCQIEWVQPC
ncbi:MAG: hypothetical protein AAF559_01525 [Pseudomonadota bacterium]